MSEFQREDRYIVIKRSDLKKVTVAYRSHLVDPMFALLAHLPQRRFAVIESDWPEFEPVWRMIEARVTGVVPEVMRWPLKGVLPDVEGISKAVLKPVVVLASDYDALAAQRDEGLAREAELKKELVQFQDGYTEQWQSREALQQRLAEAEKDTFQARVLPWMNSCFGEQISTDKQERNHRFLEEALELIQACGATAEEAHQLVDYVYGRPVGEPSQEVGGVMVTLAALCLAQDMDMQAAAETELSRIWCKVEQIRAKQAAKPAFGPLPGSYPERLSDLGCADSETATAPEVHLPRRKVKTEYSTAEEDAQADAWNAALDAVQELNR